jgi:F-type H+-transporting ATPase subunit b
MTRRTRYIGWALGLGIVAGLFTASPAAAQEESVGLCVFEELLGLEESGGSLEALEEEGGDALKSFEDDLEKCVEAPSPIIPELDEIIWGGSAFLVLFGFMVWKGFPAVQGAMDARAEKIAADLDAADQARTEAARIKSDRESELAGAKAEASRLIDEARTQADQVKADLVARANEEVAEMRARAAADADAARSQALADLRGDVSEIAIGAAERVIRTNLDHDTQRALVDAYIDEVAGRG